MQRRSYVRLDITMPVKYAEVAKELESLLEENGWEGILQDSSIPWETGTIMDISGGGINLAANRPLEEGDRVYVYIRSEELEIGIKGEVVRRYTKILDNVAVYHHGVKFVEINEAERDRIIGFIFKKYREIRHKGVES